MLETDDLFENERDDPILSMNNLKDVPFTDFMILHKIFPKLFILEMDTRSMAEQPARGRLTEKA